MRKQEHVKFNQWFATAICGNDILSSCLYVSGIAVAFGGIFAPLILGVIALVLFMYKSVYTEVVEALPINGGAYNCLLNSTDKTIAAIAGVTTILSYIATCVLSATVSIAYLHTLIPVPIIPVTIFLLFLFAVLVILGLKDSSKIAFGIFCLHIFTLIIFVLLGSLFILSHHSFFMENLIKSKEIIQSGGGVIKALFFSFAASLLGVSGFESSANFVEEQEEGVFRKTLRNMLIAVAIFNPLIAIIVLGLAPISTIIAAKDFLLADQALLMGGKWLQYFIVIDAVLVLAGAVLTSFIGVSGLVYRMAADACLPEFLTRKNSRGSYPIIIILFFLLCSSILLLTQGNLLSLAGVYTIAFLSVMSLFALGNLILRQTRSELKRTYSAPILFVILAFSATFLGIIGNILIDKNNIIYFSLYFFPSVLLVLLMVYRDQLLTLILKTTPGIKPLHKFILNHYEDVTSGKIIAFVNHANRLYEILNYIHLNETAKNVILVHCRNWDNNVDKERFKELNEALPFINKVGMFPNLSVSLVYENEPFGTEAINNISKKFRVRKNRIMIGSIHHFHPFEYSDLGGVRIIF